uniref:Uncharacterized protein n=1 Tax=Ditylenchus dipsaci TaxID=166011 RepID=A0A915CXV4_9BILA
MQADVIRMCVRDTCLDKRVMHPNLTEFRYRCSQAIQGTANPDTLPPSIYDSTAGECRWREVENVTNCLCYAHGIVTSPVSVPDRSIRLLIWLSIIVTLALDLMNIVQADGSFRQSREQRSVLGDMSQKAEARSIPTKFWA